MAINKFFIFNKRPKLKWTLLVLFGLSVFGFSSCGLFTKTNKQLSKAVLKIPYTTTRTIALADGNRLRTVITKRDESPKPTLVFVHGAPGGVDNFFNFHEDSLMVQKYNLVSYERPGYGFKTGNESVVRFEDQAQVLTEILDSLGLDTVHLVSHSFGGPVALEMSYAHPQRILSSMTVAVAVSPQHEKYFWLGKLSIWKATKWLLPKAIQVAGDEKYSHEVQLKIQQPKLAKIKTKMRCIHGNKDGIVPYQNLAYLQQHLTQADAQYVTLKGEGHLIPFTEFEWMRDQILDFVH